MQEFNDLNTQLHGLIGSVDKMKVKMDQAMMCIPAEHLSKIKPLQDDMTRALQSLKSGDATKLNEILTKYK